MGIQLNTHYFCKEKFIHIVYSSYMGGKHKLAVNPKKKAHRTYFYLALTSSSAWLFLTSPLWPSSTFPIVCEIKHQFACL
jgi:hypothetical protein